jgi:probable F420-dependent oxidoreductase
MDIGHDVAMIRVWAEAVDELGYADVSVTEHVLGFQDDPAPSIYGPIVPETVLQEPFVLFGYLAAVTRRVTLSTGIVVLPQRQTALVAKQAAAVDVVCSGRLRLGVGVGYVPAEYEALDADYHSRGARIIEQIAVLRLLWTEQVASFHGRWHRFDSAGISPLPVQRPIPVWMGGMSDVALRRAATTCDGWQSVLLTPNDRAMALIERFHGYVSEAGRSLDEVGLGVWLPIRSVSADDWADNASAWRELGVTDLTVDFMGAGLSTIDDHLDALRRVAEQLAIPAP